MNMDLGRHSIRRRTLHARSIGDTAPGLVDYSHFISTARGYTLQEKNEHTNRYIGFTRARITDPSSQRYEYNDYIKWLDSLANTLSNHGKKTLTVFDRFASFTNTPSNPEPCNILLDIDDVLDSFQTISPTNKKKKETLIFDNICYSIEGEQFTCVINSEEYKVGIKYDLNKQIYKLTSKEIENTYVRLDPLTNKKRENLITYLNRSQSFRIIPKTPGIIYAYSKWYKPNLLIYGKKSQFDLSHIPQIFFQE
jgi:hypothetical protein